MASATPTQVCESTLPSLVQPSTVTPADVDMPNPNAHDRSDVEWKVDTLKSVEGPYPNKVPAGGTGKLRLLVGWAPTVVETDRLDAYLADTVDSQPLKDMVADKMVGFGGAYTVVKWADQEFGGSEIINGPSGGLCSVQVTYGQSVWLVSASTGDLQNRITRRSIKV
ncbi:hypothetical protein LTR53_005102 [Teratosphaeriaceae sp. CCFEE 6253]|nr:hypothetical protein LTR53_005102 [Teratosphaeriaceae sp. CCFEE 6253]